MMATRATKNGSSGSENAEGTPISEMLKREFLKFGVPKQIVTDNGPAFGSKSLSDALASLGIKHRTEA
jgi:transposase InsO family protein